MIRRWSLRRRVVAIVVALAVVVSGGALVKTVMDRGEEEEQRVKARELATSAVTPDQLAAVARTKVFFGHQSVGGNLIDAIPSIYAEHKAATPTIVEGPGPDGAAGFFSHAYVGRNGEPEVKIADFDAKIRAGAGKQVDVAFMKLCYVDIFADTDVDTLFAKYRSTMAALERDYPNVTFLHLTVPLTTERGLKERVKARLGRGDAYGPAENAARERLNSLIRREYGGDRLFDIAAIESTAPDGARVSGSYDGRDYYALFGGYASDVGHLNAEGSSLAAARLLSLIARASGA